MASLASHNRLAACLERKLNNSPLKAVYLERNLHSNLHRAGSLEHSSLHKAACSELNRLPSQLRAGSLEHNQPKLGYSELKLNPHKDCLVRHRSQRKGVCLVAHSNNRKSDFLASQLREVFSATWVPTSRHKLQAMLALKPCLASRKQLLSHSKTTYL